MALGPMPIKRDAFLYMEGSGDKQCGTCWLWNPETHRCAVLPNNLEVRAEDSCGYWGQGKEEDIAQPFEYAPLFTVDEVGFVRREVRCENCYHFAKDTSECGLFDTLNKVVRGIFDLDTRVSPKGCCNAQTPRRARVVT